MQHTLLPFFDIGLTLDNSFANELPMLCKQWAPQAAPRPQWLAYNPALAQQLGLDADLLSGEKGLTIFAGQALPSGAQPVAQAYAGHQFGGFSPQLGDGRALLLGELTLPQGQRLDIALKGSGRTPFARGGDGKAAIGPMLREYLISEAMHALGIPTTRSLAVVTTGETIRREHTLQGAIMCRIAASHLRVGTFEYVATHHSTDTLEVLVRYALQRHYTQALSADNPALALLHAVVDAQAALIARWMGVGFIHGVMNTDNMTISGETIDYGPCAFMETHDPQAVFSSIDHRGRYAYGNQPNIAQWNLARFAETLLPLLHTNIDQAVSLATDAVQAFRTIHARYWLQELRAKLGLTDCVNESDDLELAHDYLRLLHTHRVDHTLGFRLLADALRHSLSELNVLFGEAAPQLDNWLQRWKQRLSLEAKPFEEVANSMDLKNPWVIPRNHRVEEALLLASESGDLQVFQDVLTAVTHPYDKPEFKADAEPAPQSFTAQFQTFCGT